MNSWYRLVLNPKGAFAGEFDSIKIYGSIISGYAELYGDAFEILEKIKSGKLQVSSPMPLNKDNFYVFKPMLPSIEKIEYKDFKKFKSTRYVEESIALDVLSEGAYSKEHVERILKDKKVGIRTLELPGVSIERFGSTTEIYYKIANLYTHKAWLLIKMDDDIRDRVIAVLRYLGDMGISKKRTTGFGHFEVEVKDYTPPNEMRYKMLLSKYIPSPEDLKTFPFETSRYEVKLITGYSRTGAAIPKLRALVEGSVFPSKYSPVGRIVDVHSNYSVVGIPLAI